MVSFLMRNGVAHGAGRRASSSSALVALVVKADVFTIVPLNDEDGEARPPAVSVLLSKHGAFNVSDAGLRAALGHPRRA